MLEEEEKKEEEEEKEKEEEEEEAIVAEVEVTVSMHVVPLHLCFSVLRNHHHSGVVDENIQLAALLQKIFSCAANTVQAGKIALKREKHG